MMLLSIYSICRCTPIEDQNHICFDLDAKNNTFSYPHQVLPGGTTLPSENIVTAITFLQNPNPLCITPFRHIICLFPNPPCSNETNLLLPICPDSCLAFNRLIQEKRCEPELLGIERGLVTAGMQSGEQSFFIVLGILAQFDCRNVNTYYFYGANVTSFLDPEQCTHIQTPNEIGKPAIMFKLL